MRLYQVGEFFELYNSNDAEVDLTGWTVSTEKKDGLEFTFPPGSSIDAGAYIVVAKDVDFFESHYKSSVDVYGPFLGSFEICFEFFV